ncbi:MAG: hypothetical protein MUQ65_08175, partial [Armatimonadetes bacterium]|nr:hypothetical protein [Armatimonadota bacterium]
NVSVPTLDRLVKAINGTIDRFKEAGRLQAFKVGMAYGRDLLVADPTRHEAELAFKGIRNRRRTDGGMQQGSAPVNAREARPLGDYLVHRSMERAHDEDIPVQIHTGYLALNWMGLTGTSVELLIPIFDTYRRVRFDIFHAS